MNTPKFDRPEQDEYLDWLDSLPECTRCEGTGWVHGEFDGEQLDCGSCNGSGKVFPDDSEPDDEIDACDETLEGWPCRAGFALILAILFLFPFALVAQPPTPEPPIVTPALEKLIEELSALRKQQSELSKKDAAKAADVRKQIDDLAKKLKALGIDLCPPGPSPIPPIPPVPIPPDPPIPVPPIPPQPAGKVARFVVVEETSTASSWRGDILGSPKVAAFYRALQGGKPGAIHRLIDFNTPGTDPAAIYFQQAAQGKALPWLWLLDSDGQILKSLACPQTAETFIAAFELQPGKRAMGLNLAKPKLRWEKFGDNPRVPLIRRENWKEVSLAAFLPPVHDQDGRGQCASSAACTLLEACRIQAGLGYVYLSGGDLYSRVNGGRDQGSMLEDNLAELLKNGVATAQSVPYVWDGRRRDTAAIRAERLPYRVVEVYLCESFDAMASAVQQGFLLEHGLMWRDNFEPDGDGWLPAVGRGGAGGHALVGYGLAKRGNVYAISTRNSWGESWGAAGNCHIPESLFDANIGGWFAVRAVVQTPTDFPYPRKTAGLPRSAYPGFVLAP